MLTSSNATQWQDPDSRWIPPTSVLGRGDLTGKIPYGSKPDKQPVESDPNGIDQHEKGAKLDADKPDMMLVLGSFSRALIEVANIGTYGAKKYTEGGWLEVPNGIRRYESAELRHQFKQSIEGRYDIGQQGSGFLHKAHKAWCALAALELELLELEKNGEPTRVVVEDAAN